jgi:ADP-ribosylation factor-like protein 6
MGFFTDILRALGFLKRPARVIVVGLDNAGKSMLINQLKPRRAASYEVTPTVGFSMDRFERGGFTFSVWDMSGAGAYRSLWETYYKEADAIIFVVDSSDRLRLCVARDELRNVLEHPDVVSRKPPMLFFANKMDLPGAVEPKDMAEDLGLHAAVKDRPWQISASNALTGEGIDKGIEWLISALNQREAAAAKAK